MTTQSMHSSCHPILFFLLLPALAAGDDRVDFSHDVIPVLRQHCVECHGGQQSKGGFSLNSRELVLDAGVVTVGDAQQSAVVERLYSDDPELRMPPPDRPALKPGELRTLAGWIDEGLKWEQGFSFGENFYEPPLRPRTVSLPDEIDGRTHPVDRIIDDYFAVSKGRRPAAISDGTFLRRVYLDVVGLLPTPEESSHLLKSGKPLNRHRVIQSLLEEDIAYTEHWLTFWNDLLRNDYAGTGFITKGRSQISRWLYGALLENKPYDQFVRELITPAVGASGFIEGIRWRGNVNASQRQELQFAQNVSQAFLGINLKCASCHDSFIDRWTLEETYAFAQIYATEPLELHRCDKPNGQTAVAAWLFPELGQIDANADRATRLQQLAGLLTHPDNARFARTIVNRIWHRLMGRGIVHPVDAMHTEPWSEDLLDFLAAQFIVDGYDLRKLIQFICTSQAYQSQMPSADELQGGKYVYSGPLPRRLTAEQFVDAVWQVTGTAPQKFDAPVTRIPLKHSDANMAASGGVTATKTPAAKWIWSADGQAPAGQKITFRRRFRVDAIPERMACAITCDNEYELWVNGRRIGSDGDWTSVEVYDMTPYIKAEENIITVVATNAGETSNPAALYFEARFRGHDQTETTLGSDSTWRWTRATITRSGKFRKPAADWENAAEVANSEIWSVQTAAQIVAGLTRGLSSPQPMVRSALLKANELTRALGRPNRDQIVTMRPDQLTTLEAIQLANGQQLADAVAAGAARMVSGSHGPQADRVDWLFRYLLTRRPTAEERELVRTQVGANPDQQSMEDMLWTMIMLPEFQLVR